MCHITLHYFFFIWPVCLFVCLFVFLYEKINFCQDLLKTRIEKWVLKRSGRLVFAADLIANAINMCRDIKDLQHSSPRVTNNKTLVSKTACLTFISMLSRGSKVTKKILNETLRINKPKKKINPNKRKPKY